MSAIHISEYMKKLIDDKHINTVKVISANNGDTLVTQSSNSASFVPHVPRVGDEVAFTTSDGVLYTFKVLLVRTEYLNPIGVYITVAVE